MTTATISDLAVSVSRTDLLGALKLCGMVTEQRSTIPILGYVKITSEPNSNELRIVATDLDVTVITKLRARSDCPGSIAIELTRLADAVRTSDGESVSIEGAAGAIQLQCGTAKFRLPSYPASDYPIEPKPLGDISMDVPSATLREMFRAASYATTKEEARFQLLGTLLRSTGKRLEAVSSDGYRLALASLPLTAPQIDIFISPKATRVVSTLTGEFSRIVAGENLSVTDGNVSIVARTIDVNFPNYRGVIADLPKTARIDRAKFLAAVRRAAPFASEGTRACKFSFTPGRLAISAASQERGAADDYIAIDYSGEATHVGLCSHYLADALSAITSDALLFQFQDPQTQVQLTPDPNDGDFTELHLIMPITV